MKSQLQIWHIWGDYTPSLFDQTHPSLLNPKLNTKGFSSSLFCRRFLDNGSKLYPHSFAVEKIDPIDAFPNNFLDRVIKKIKEPIHWHLLEKKIIRSLVLAFQRKNTASNIILHFHFGTTAAELLPLMKLATKLKIKKIVSLYGVDASAALKQPKYQSLYREMLAHTDVLHVLCKEVENRFINFGFDPKKIFTWNLPAGIEQYPYREKKVSSPFRFLIVARFVEKKGYRFLLAAFDKICTQDNDIELTMMGYGPFYNTLKELTAHNKKIKIINTELSANFGELFQQALQTHDAFVLPSTVAQDGDDEGGPALTMVCAQHAGLPTISTPFAGAERSLEDEINGFYCLQDDSDSLSEKMLKLKKLSTENENYFYSMGKNGSKHVFENFSLNRQIEKLIHLYGSLQ